MRKCNHAESSTSSFQEKAYLSTAQNCLIRVHENYVRFVQSRAPLLLTLYKTCFVVEIS